MCFQSFVQRTRGSNGTETAGFESRYLIDLAWLNIDIFLLIHIISYKSINLQINLTEICVKTALIECISYKCKTLPLIHNFYDFLNVVCHIILIICKMKCNKLPPPPLIVASLPWALVKTLYQTWVCTERLTGIFWSCALANCSLQKTTFWQNGK